ncbi:MAG: hypothetical protein ACPGOV_06625 [Magnetovibrionaceae bacterium]
MAKNLFSLVIFVRLVAAMGICGSLLVLAVILLGPKFGIGDPAFGPYEQMAVVVVALTLAASLLLIAPRTARSLERNLRPGRRMFQLFGLCALPMALTVLGFAVFHPDIQLTPDRMLIFVGGGLLVLVLSMVLASGSIVIAANAALLFGLIGAAEGAARLLPETSSAPASAGQESEGRPSQPKGPVRTEGTYYQSYFRFDADLGYSANPNITATTRKTRGDQLVYDAVYTINELGFRKTPQSGNDGDKTVQINLFGGSFAFGEGLADGETLAARLAQLMPEAELRNYGFHGYGPQQILALLEAGRLSPVASGQTPVAVYLFKDGHIPRLLGSHHVVTNWGHHMPYYRLTETGSVERAGNFTSGRPLRAFLNAIAANSRLIERFNASFDALFESGDGYRLAAALLAQACSLFEAKTDGAACYVALYPGSVEAQANLIAPLTERGVPVLDFTTLFDDQGIDPSELIIVGDGHPSALAFKVLAGALYERFSAADWYTKR